MLLQIGRPICRERWNAAGGSKKYDCLAAGYYAILPGFRYITDDRFHELPEDIQDIIRTGAWYQGPSMHSSWPLEEDDEQWVTERDRRLEEPWNYFSDVDEFLIYDAEAAEKRGRELTDTGGKAQRNSGRSIKVLLCAGAGTDQGTSGQGAVPALCATETGQEASGQGATPALCTAVTPSGEDSSSRSIARSGDSNYDAEALSKAREICTMPHGADPAETFLMDILADDSSPRKRTSTMSIRFFLPEELYELWNLAFRTWLMRTVAEEMTDGTEYCDSVGDYAEGFLAALLQDWLLTERLQFKVTENYAILKRDHFRSISPSARIEETSHPHSHG